MNARAPHLLTANPNAALVHLRVDFNNPLDDRGCRYGLVQNDIIPELRQPVLMTDLEGGIEQDGFVYGTLLNGIVYVMPTSKVRQA